MKCAAANEVAIDDARGINEDSTGDFKVELALRHRRHLAALDAAGVRRNFDAVADACDWLVLSEEVSGNSDQVLVVPNVFRSPAATEEDANGICRIDLGEGMVCRDLVALPFPSDRPAGADLVEDHLVGPLFGGDDNWPETRLLKTIERIEGVDGFSGITDDDENAGAIVLGLRHLAALLLVGLRAGGRLGAYPVQMKPARFAPNYRCIVPAVAGEGIQVFTCSAAD